jgi:hypothetical protein
MADGVRRKDILQVSLSLFFYVMLVNAVKICSRLTIDLISPALSSILPVMVQRSHADAQRLLQLLARRRGESVFSLFSPSLAYHRLYCRGREKQ